MLPEGSRLLLKTLTTAKQLARRPRRSLASLTEPLSHSLRPLGTRADLLISSLPLPIGIYWLSGSQPVLSRFRQVAASGWFGMELYGTIVCCCATYLPLASCKFKEVERARETPTEPPAHLSALAFFWVAQRKYITSAVRHQKNPEARREERGFPDSVIACILYIHRRRRSAGI